MGALLLHIGICVLLLVATTAIHATAMVFSFEVLQLGHAERWGPSTPLRRVGLVSALIVTMFIASLLETTLWATVFIAAGALPDPATALYFSMVTFTTLGYGDVTLAEGYRVLSSFAAVNGTIMFGWTTALIMSLVHRLYRPDAQS